jgi:AcrR family transcriptional regulator
MARWEPNARERFLRAALDLFAEQGYDATTVNEIADRAGLTKTTFFRHFTDKREVIFAGQSAHTQVLSDAIASAPAATAPLDTVRAALDALTATFTEVHREFGAQLRVVIAGNTELQERAAFKRAGLVGALTDGLSRRGLPAPAAGLAAEIGISAFYRAFDLWVAQETGRESLTHLTRQALDELLTATAELTSAGRPPSP